MINVVLQISKNSYKMVHYSSHGTIVKTYSDELTNIENSLIDINRNCPPTVSRFLKKPQERQFTFSVLFLNSSLISPTYTTNIISATPPSRENYIEVETKIKNAFVDYSLLSLNESSKKVEVGKYQLTYKPELLKRSSIREISALIHTTFPRANIKFIPPSTLSLPQKSYIISSFDDITLTSLTGLSLSTTQKSDLSLSQIYSLFAKQTGHPVALGKKFVLGFSSFKDVQNSTLPLQDPVNGGTKIVTKEYLNNLLRTFTNTLISNSVLSFKDRIELTHKIIITGELALIPHVEEYVRKLLKFANVEVYESPQFGLDPSFGMFFDAIYNTLTFPNLSQPKP